MLFSVDELLAALKNKALVFTEPHWPLNIIREDLSDNKFLACALTSGADFIVSGDRHLLALKEFQGILIVSARQFLAKFRTA